MKTTYKRKVEKSHNIDSNKKITIGVVLVELFPGASAILTNEI
jgi:hypothetical protein